MNVLARTELKTLIQKQPGPAVSIFIPTHRAGPDTRKNPIIFKNAVGTAEERLIESGLRAPEARQLLQPARELVEEYDFWQHQSDGLAGFVSSEGMRTYRLPLDFEELVVVADRFHLKPLMPLLSGDGRFYVLALSQNEIRMLQGSRDSIDELDLSAVPDSLAEALRFDEPYKQQQFHTATATPGGQGGRPAMFHGQGVGTDEERANIRRYFQQIDRGVQELLQNETAPLVLAGVDFLFPIYKEANGYPHLLDKGVPGNPEQLSPAELHSQVWAVVQPHFQQAQQEARARFRHLTGTDQISKDIRQIVPAAHYGRVETLFVAVGKQQWGHFDPDTNSIELHAEAESGDEDLLDAAAVQTFSHGGTVYALEPDQVPDQVPLAAVFRYG